MIRKYAEIFCWKNVSSFCSAKATQIFSAKNIRILYIESAKIVNEMTLNELVKLTTLWTTGPRAPNKDLVEGVSDSTDGYDDFLFFFLSAASLVTVNFRLLEVFQTNFASFTDKVRDYLNSSFCIEDILTFTFSRWQTDDIFLIFSRK